MDNIVHMKLWQLSQEERKKKEEKAQKLEKIHKSIEASKLIDKMVESIRQCQDGLITIPEMLSYIDREINSMPKEATFWGKGYQDQLDYIEKSKRQYLIDKFSHTDREIEKFAEVNMKNLLSYIRALYQMYQHMHWRSAGTNYYGDHLLYERLYNDVQEEIDGVAERAIGIKDDPDAIGPVSDAVLSAGLIKKFVSDDDKPSEFPEKAMKAEKGLLALIKNMMSEDQSDGVQNLLQGIADKHEVHLYLLQQRARKEASISYKLSKIANSLDEKGYYDLASIVDKILKEMK